MAGCARGNVVVLHTVRSQGLIGVVIIVVSLTIRYLNSIPNKVAYSIPQQAIMLYDGRASTTHTRPVRYNWWKISRANRNYALDDIATSFLSLKNMQDRIEHSKASLTYKTISKYRLMFLGFKIISYASFLNP